MRRVPSALLSLFLCVAALAQQPKPVEPDFSGLFFFLQPDSSLRPLQPEIVGAYIINPGFVPGRKEIVAEIEKEHSALRVTAAAMLPIVVRLERTNTEPANVVALQRLEISKDKRTYQMAKQGIIGRQKTTMQQTQIPLNFAKYGENSVKITPQSTLPPGEYVISMHPPSIERLVIAYSFGVDAPN
jgi:hypothetical protein